MITATHRPTGDTRLLTVDAFALELREVYGMDDVAVRTRVKWVTSERREYYGEHTTYRLAKVDAT